jgi:hypothetical protein
MNETASAYKFWQDNQELDKLDTMVEFAKLCVSNALSAVQFHKKLRVTNLKERTVDLLDSYECGDDEITVDFSSIRKAYPLSNIRKYPAK